MEKALEQTAQTTTLRLSLLEVLKILEPYSKLKFACNPPVGHNVRVHSGHIHVSFALLSAFLRITGDVLLNNGVDIKFE